MEVVIFYGHLVYFETIWYILWTLGIPILWTFGLFSSHLVYFIDTLYIFRHLVYFVVLWVYLYRVGMLHQEKSGNPDRGVTKGIHVGVEVFFLPGSVIPFPVAFFYQQVCRNRVQASLSHHLPTLSPEHLY
jgi:hypothetical protein